MNPSPMQTDYLNIETSLKSWLLTRDHKRIAWLYLGAVLFFFVIGAIAAAMFRIELLTPKGDFFSPDFYNRLFTIHGIVMVWFFLVPVIPATLGNFLLPLMIGSKDLAFPTLNLVSWYVFVVGGLFTIWTVAAGGVDTGWTFYTPFSSVYSNSNTLTAATGIFITGFSSIMTGINFIATIHRMRAPGMSWLRLPVFVWTLYSTSLIFILATPVLSTVLILLFLETQFGMGFFNPVLGGDPLLFQHLFWFYSHPAVYIMVLPAMGIVSEIVPQFARNKIFGYRFIVGATLAIAVIGFLVWGHHMFVSGQSLYSNMIFSFLSFVVGVPSAIKVFNWTATLYRGSISFEAPMIYALGFIFLFTIGGMSGLFLATLSIDVHVHDTYFVVAHFHYIMVGGSILALLGGVHYWFPKVTGRLYPERLAQGSAWLIIAGFNFTFFPQFILGYMGMPRRYQSYPDRFQTLNVLSSAGAFILAVGYLLPFLYLTWSLFKGAKSGPNPWNSDGLEWQTSSPPIKENFAHAVTYGFRYLTEEAKSNGVET
ncbi:MAG: cytochrome c oxidase subunit I [Chitinophagaceae bacterium]|nr:cytochrome c oxidase subunit I [Oligoflexus sp.]